MTLKYSDITKIIVNEATYSFFEVNWGKRYIKKHFIKDKKVPIRKLTIERG